MSAELRIPSAAAILVPLADRLPPLAASVWTCDGSALRAWAAPYGLPTEAGCHRLACRLMPEGRLFARWLTWAFAFDDWCDEGTGSRDWRVLDALVGRLRQAMRTGYGTDEPLVAAFADLWRATRPGMSPAWARRFANRLELQADACRVQALNRAAGRIPTPGEYPALRRHAFCGFMMDLLEPCLRVEVPARLHATPPWRTLVDAASDVIAWCNDIASLPREQGDPHNYVRIAAVRIGVPDPAEWVADRIAERAEDLRDAALALPRACVELGVGGEVALVAQCLLSGPRAHLEWLLESDRYRST
ncbi:terpene synthase family protein [Acrocarpospora catenulata]|uniref:terpene synthase family protein n=1 Tax=Acrocarpospora catenulata TaxID=2836182 RepID=UPI001BD998DF|nr:terpene synthase family protein [Acrocarpospora catenulata]